MTKEQVNDAITAMDRNGDESISYDEFVPWWLATIAPPEPPTVESVLLQDVASYNTLLHAPPSLCAFVSSAQCFLYGERMRV